MIIFLYGDDVFRSSEKLNTLKENFLNKNTSNANSSVFDFNESNSFEKLHTMLSAEGLFSSKKLVVIKNIIDSSDKIVQDKMFEYLDSNKLSSDVTLIFWEKNEPRKNNKLFKLLVDKFKSENFKKLIGANLSNWIKKEFEIKKVDIDSPALNKLMSFVGDDLFQMKNEIDKLSNFAKNNVTEKDIDLIVKSKIEANIFETIESIGTKDKNRALKLFHDQLDQGDDPFYVFSMYIYQFRNLLKIGSFYFEGTSDKNIVAKETKLHPFVVQKGMSQLSYFSPENLKTIYNRLEKIDHDVKTGKIEMKDAIDNFIIEV